MLRCRAEPPSPSGSGSARTRYENEAAPVFAAAGIVTNITVSTSHNMRDTVIPYDCNLRHLLNWLCGVRQTT